MPIKIRFRTDVPATDAKSIVGFIIPQTTSTVVITNKIQNIFQIHEVPEGDS
jgi:hypothetical protein